MDKTVSLSLNRYLKELYLPTIRSCYEESVDIAVREQLGYGEFLLGLLEAESSERMRNRIERRLRESKLPFGKSLESFEIGRLPMKALQQVRSLLDGTFVDRRENVLAFGNPGSGKTHLLCAICQELIMQGRRVLYTTSSILVQELLTAKRDLALPKALKRMSGYEVLMIDDLGYVQQSREEMEVLFTLLADRYERGSVMITSNLPFSGWESIFKDPMTTAAAIDRLVHHSIILELNLTSYRIEQAKNEKQTGETTQEEKREK